MKAFYTFLLSLAFFFFSTQQTKASVFGAPNGEPLVTTQQSNGSNPLVPELFLAATAKSLTVYNTGSDGLPLNPPLASFQISEDVNIVDAKFKYETSYFGPLPLQVASAVIIVLSDGRTATIPLDGSYVPSYGNLNIDPSSVTSKIIGDDLYAIANPLCYVSRDSGTTWQIDTAGIGSTYKYELAMDSNQRVYLATSSGLYSQELVSNQWVKNTNLSGTNCSFVFVDFVGQRIWAKSNTGFYVSDNFGASFVAAPAGITSSITSMAADYLGNIYVLSNKMIFKSVGGTQAFVQIDAGIISQLAEPVDNSTFKALGADTTLAVATKYGLFTSRDQGTTWSYFGIEAAQNYGIAKTSAGRLLVSNNNGVHSKEANDATWTKHFPASGFETAAKIFKDNSGNLYTTSQSNKLIWKSTDGGTTWNLDTVSYSNINGNVYSFYTDPLGNQHAYVLASPPLVYTRNGGGSWTIDTAGFTAANFSTSTAWGTDNNGNLYLATSSLYLQKRPIGGGTWVADTAGLLNQSVIYDLAVESNGTLWAGTYIGAFKRIGGVWQQLSYPVGTQIGVTNSCFVVSVDSAGAVWTQWSYFTVQGHAIGSGVYFTLDGGTNWTSMDLDTVTFRQLYSSGDTTYAVSYVNGLFWFTRNGGAVSVHEIKDATQNILLYPNPAKNKLTVELNEPVSEISVLDITGRKLKTISGNFTGKTEIDIFSLPKGNYLLLLRERQNMKTVKFVKQ